jgi:predicted esterase
LGAYQIVATSFSLIAVGFSQRSIIKISVGFSQKALLAKAVFFCHHNPSAKADGNKELSIKTTIWYASPAFRNKLIRNKLIYFTK